MDIGGKTSRILQKTVYAMSDLSSPWSWKTCFCLQGPYLDLLPLDTLNTCSQIFFNGHQVWVTNMFLFSLTCFPDVLDHFPAARLLPSCYEEKTVKNVFLTWDRSSRISRDWSSHFPGQVIQHLMKTLQTSWNSISIQSSTDPLSRSNMHSYCKLLKSYAQVCHPQVKETFPDPSSKEPIGHSLKPGDWVF